MAQSFCRLAPGSRASRLPPILSVSAAHSCSYERAGLLLEPKHRQGTHMHLHLLDHAGEYVTRWKKSCISAPLLSIWSSKLLSVPALIRKLQTLHSHPGASAARRPSKSTGPPTLELHRPNSQGSTPRRVGLSRRTTLTAQATSLEAPIDFLVEVRLVPSVQVLAQKMRCTLRCRAKSPL